MFKKISILLLLFTVFLSQAQEPFYKTFSWETQPDIKKFDIDKNEDMIAFKDNRVVEFFFLEDGFTEFELIHKILWLNSDDRIEAYNKIYLPYDSNSELLANKARVITPKGKVLELDDSKILTSTDEETNRSYKYFALEGIELGSFIEYYYVVRKYPGYRGKRVTMQNSYNKHNVSFELFAPEHLIFDFKSFNGLQEISRDTLSKEKNHWVLNVDSIEKLEKEEQSAYNAEKKFLVYKLEANNANDTKGLSSYKGRAKSFYEYLFVNLDKSEVKLLNELISSMDIDQNQDDLNKIRAIENHIKSNFYTSEVRSGELENLEQVLSSKTANETGMMRLYVAILKTLEIPVEVVLTTDRFETRFDMKFESGNFLTDYLLYFPSVKQFTSVIEIGSRVGIPPHELTDNYGLFIKEVSLGDFKSAVGKIKYINAPTEKVSADNMLIKVKFDKDDLSINNIHLEKSYSGYYAGYIQPYANFMNQEVEEEMYDEIIKSVHESFEIVDKKAHNNDVELFGVKPFIIETNVTSESFTNKAGKKYLFKLGELIGSQIEMYQENDRKLAVEAEFNRSYIRTLEIEVPDGFQIKNPEDINIEFNYDKNGERIAMFHSYFELNGNLLTVHADEYYRENRVELEYFEDYKAVINAAADFNKIVLILEPVQSN